MNNKIPKNKKLLDAMHDVKINNDDTTENVFYKELNSSEFVVPVVIDNAPNSTKIKLIKIIDSTGKDYFPIFTDFENMKLGNFKETTIFSINDLISIISQDFNISGIVINPYTNNFILTKKNIEFLKSLQKKVIIPKGTTFNIGTPSIYQKRIIEKCISFFKKDPSVSNAYLLQIVPNENEKALLLVIDSDSKNEKLFSEVCDSVGSLIENDYSYIDIIPLESIAEQSLIEEIEPFYTNSHKKS